jgi:uncharacterized protein (DUF697 family)
MSDVTSSKTPPDIHEEEALQTVREYMGWTFAGGLIPLPFADIAAVTAVQLRMLQRLSQIYSIPFSRNLVKELVSSLLGSTLPSLLTSGLKGVGLNMIPVVGPLVSMVLMPGLSSAATYAIGKVFIQHFEAGGTFLDFRPSEVREYFRHAFDEARGGRHSGGPRGSSPTAAA